MNLTLTRKWFTNSSTIGELQVNGQFECFTLEDRVRPAGIKVPGSTAIPLGTYGIVLTRSPRFNTILPLLVDVPNYLGVRIHAGNTHLNTEGCILVGKLRYPDLITQSRAALAELLAKMQEAQARDEEIELTIQGHPPDEGHELAKAHLV